MSLLLIIILPLLGSICAALMPHNARHAEAWLAGFVTLATTLLVIILYFDVAESAVLRFSIPWIPTVGWNFSLRMDAFAWLFSLIISGMGTLIVLYAHYYMSPSDPVPRFFSFFQAFMAAMLGVVLSANLLQIAMFWELTSLTSFMLIAYWHHRADARRGARMAFTITGAGGLSMLVGMVMLGHMAGSYDLDVVLQSGEIIRAHPWYNAMFILIALGALSKSAQFPFHFWLPQAMAAPTPVSAYLHSATMVKAGVFLLTRLWPVLSGTDIWFWVIGGAGLLTLVTGAYLALFQYDMKGVLAYSTISHLGLITLLLGMNSPLALIAAIFHIINHATFKASLFMAVGIIDHETGTRDMRRLSGLRRVMPITATLAIVAAAAMAGVPLLNGFLSKEMFFAEAVSVENASVHNLGLPIAATIAGLFSVAYSLRFIHQSFFGPPARDLPLKPHDPPGWMLAPSALLVLACLLVGIFPNQTIYTFLQDSAKAILGADTPSYSLTIWHGFSPAFIMSLIAMTGGILLYLLLYKFPVSKAPLLGRIDAQRFFESAMNGLMTGSERLTHAFFSRRLQTQLLLFITITLAGALLPLLRGQLHWGTGQSPFHIPFALLWIMGAGCALATAHQAKHHRLIALVFSGGTGLATILTFVWFSAPDLALTQITVEVVTVILILLGLRWLPKRIEDIKEKFSLRTKTRRMRDLIISIIGGSCFASLTYVMLTRPPTDSISRFFVEKSLPEGGGLNIVNVILVDFRGFDTLGEITVLAIVAITVFALLRRFRPAPESIALPQQQDDVSVVPADPDPQALLPRGPMMLPAVLVRLLLPLATMISIFFMLRGHNAPGGGFVGGLIFATAIILQYIVSGTVWVEARLRLLPVYWMAFGLLFAGLTSMAAWFAGFPFLTSMTLDLHLPILGELHLSSVLLFDLGVYMLVIGATILILIALAHQSLRSQSRKTA